MFSLSKMKRKQKRGGWMTILFSSLKSGNPRLDYFYRIDAANMASDYLWVNAGADGTAADRPFFCGRCRFCGLKPCWKNALPLFMADIKSSSSPSFPFKFEVLSASDGGGSSTKFFFRRDISRSYNKERNKM